MNASSMEQGLRARLWVIDIPCHIRVPLGDLVCKWVQSSGVEWTISRLKSLKVDFYRRRAGLSPLTAWVRKNRRGDLAGTIGTLFRYGDQSDKNFRKVVQCLMCYTVFQFTHVTPQQVKKFTTALNAAPPPTWGKLEAFRKAIKRTFGGMTVDRSEDVSLICYRGSSSKRKPSVGSRSVPQDSDILGDYELFITNGHKWGMNLLNKYRQLFSPVLEGLRTPFLDISVYRKEYDSETIRGGKIAFIQEPGGKLRSVASPYLLYQLALRHFGKAVYKTVSCHLPWDCTHDQSKPINVLMDTLKDGTTVHSVDLSSATDYFPREVQVEAMRAIFGNLPDIDLFEVISQSTWESPLGDIKWNRGQPLGLFPSFAVFTATHGLLLWFLNGCTWNKEFYVLGDDVVILKDDLYHRYLETLKEWDCPHSPDKSVSSNQICEFAGKVITRESVTPQYKWREMSNDNFIDICRQLGQRSRILLSTRQKVVFDHVKHCTSPLGLGFSFPGSKLEDLERKTQETFGSGKERMLDSMTDQAAVVYQNFYGSNPNSNRQLYLKTDLNFSSILEKVATFDKKVRLVLKRLLPWFTEVSDPKGFSQVPGALGVNELPPAQRLPSRCTELDRYERLLGITPVAVKTYRS